MFNNSTKKKELIAPDNKTEEKIAQDFITHNMPAPHRFSGQTFGDESAKSDQAIGPQTPNHQAVGLLIIGGGLVLIIALIYFGYSYFIKPSVQQQPAPVVTDNIATETPVVTPPKIDDNVLPVEIATETPIISTSTNQEVASSTINFPEETPVVNVPVTVSTVDSDSDGLTDAEEKIIGTDPNKADTDSDGYSDLAEIKSGYDPLIPGSKLSENSQVLAYQIDANATAIYPAAWEVTRSEVNDTIIFADSDKAFIQLNTDDNALKTAPESWFEAQFPGILPGEAVSGDTWQGFYSQDGLAAYIFNKDLSKVYSFSCVPLTSDTNSVTVFHLMIKTLVIK